MTTPMRAVIHGVIHGHVEERRLQNAGGKNDLVLLRIEIGVDRLRRHVPFGAVHRLADAGDFAVRLKGGRAADVAQIDRRAGLSTAE